MSLLPPPSQAQTEAAGSLTKPWVNAVIISQLLIAGSLLTLTFSARAIGKPTWWLGSQHDPAFFLLWFLPFVAPIAMLVAATKFSTILPYIGLGSTLFLVAISISDLSRTPGIAIGELAMAVCMALTTIAAMAGRRRSISTGI
jgi:predicted neutral ceramidase superfamily lipid hydrolase